MNIADIGQGVVDLILGGADFLFLRDDTPGWMSLAMVVALLLLASRHRLLVRRLTLMVQGARNGLRQGGKAGITSDRLHEVDKAFNAPKGPKASAKRLTAAWREFKESSIDPGGNGEKVRNTVRPSAFFTREELGWDRGFWKQAPATFVSVGLFLTFLGLVAALKQTGELLGDAALGEGTATEGLQALLGIASTKFIMSLTGLLCSIVLAASLRRDAHAVDEALHGLCDDIEHGCDFWSEQEFLGKILDEAREQSNHLKTFSTELVAQVAKPLRDDIPNAIRAAVQDAMAPGVKELGTSIATGVQDSVTAMNASIAEVRDGLEAVAKRLDDSAGTMGSRMSDAVETLVRQVESLDKAMSDSTQNAAEAMTKAANSIQESSSQGVGRMKEGSEAMAEAAKNLTEALRTGIAGAAAEGGREVAKAGRGVADGMTQATDAMREAIMAPLGSLQESLNQLANGVDGATNSMSEYATAVDGSSGAIRTANSQLGEASASMTQATDPIRSAADDMKQSTRKMSDSVNEASAAMIGAAKHTEGIIRGVQSAVDAHSKTLQAAGQALQQAVAQFRGIVEQYDSSLGKAWEAIDAGLQKSMREIGDFTRNVNKECGDALSRLETVVAQAQPFEPAQEK